VSEGSFAVDEPSSPTDHHGELRLRIERGRFAWPPDWFTVSDQTHREARENFGRDRFFESAFLEVIIIVAETDTEDFRRPRHPRQHLNCVQVDCVTLKGFEADGDRNPAETQFVDFECCNLLHAGRAGYPYCLAPLNLCLRPWRKRFRICAEIGQEKRRSDRPSRMRLVAAPPCRMEDLLCPLTLACHTAHSAD
jgi:hypothetical protein